MVAHSAPCLTRCAHGVLNSRWSRKTRRPVKLQRSSRASSQKLAHQDTGWKPGGRGSDYAALGSRWLRRRVVRFHRTLCPFLQARAPWRLAPCLCDSRCVTSLLALLRVGVSDVLFISELTPMDPNVRLTKRDSPEVVDPRLHRRMKHCGMSLISG